jgi:hypothetical protein
MTKVKKIKIDPKQIDKDKLATIMLRHIQYLEISAKSLLGEDQKQVLFLKNTFQSFLIQASNGAKIQTDAEWKQSLEKHKLNMYEKTGRK